MGKRAILGLATCVSVVFLVSLAFSQQGGQGGGAGARGGQGGGGMMGGGGMRGGFGAGGVNEATAKLALGMTDQQWEPIKPKFDKVNQLLRDSRVSLSFMSGRRARGADAGGGAAAEEAAPRWMRPSQFAQQELTEGQKAAESLLDLLEKKDSDIKQIEQKVEALRAIRQKAQKELATAQGELRKLVDPRGQAKLTLMGLLD